MSLTNEKLNEYVEIHTNSLPEFIDILLEHGAKYNVIVDGRSSLENRTDKIWCKGKMKDLIKLNKKAQSIHIKK